MKGFVETPSKLVDLMVRKLFLTEPPSDSVILDPGCGTGAFIDGIIRWCREHQSSIPNIVGLDSNPRHSDFARKKFEQIGSISIKNQDFLVQTEAKYDFIIGNPPFVPITQLSQKEKETYRAQFATAVGRFDLYLLFFERALQSLKPKGRLVFITPEKFLYVEAAEALRRLLSNTNVEEIQMIDENVFEGRVTYPTITTITNQRPSIETSVIHRNGGSTRTTFPSDGSSWLPYIGVQENIKANGYLAQICERISCGVATGADSVFVLQTTHVPSDLKPFSYPTIGGRELGPGKEIFGPKHSMLIPYNRDGTLLKPDQLGSLADYLSKTEVRQKLEGRTCVSHKPWYAFHENPPLRSILRPKIICKDITHRPFFWVDRSGTIVPRHSTYYIVPKDPSRIVELADFLNSSEASKWLEANCQRAANGFLRVQSHVLKKLPIPRELARPLITLTC